LADADSSTKVSLQPNALLDAARARGAKTLWLGVWERNPRAVAFYEKYGFTRVGEHSFTLGSDVQTDWLFARPLEDVTSRK
jgi:RimJ/RimL family protein N-acetyltransferase